MKKLLITGGSGQLATAFKSNFKSNFNLLSLDRSELDITDKIKVESILANFKPDIVLNCAAYTNVDGAENDFKKANNVKNAYRTTKNSLKLAKTIKNVKHGQKAVSNTMKAQAGYAASEDIEKEKHVGDAIENNAALMAIETVKIIKDEIPDKVTGNIPNSKELESAVKSGKTSKSSEDELRVAAAASAQRNSQTY